MQEVVEEESVDKEMNIEEVKLFGVLVQTEGINEEKSIATMDRAVQTNDIN